MTKCCPQPGHLKELKIDVWTCPHSGHTCTLPLSSLLKCHSAMLKHDERLVAKLCDRLLHLAANRRLQNLGQRVAGVRPVQCIAIEAAAFDPKNQNPNLQSPSKATPLAQEAPGEHVSQGMASGMRSTMMRCR